MLDVGLGLALFFLIWSHFITTFFESISRIGEITSLKRVPYIYRYTYLYRLNSSTPSFDSLLFTVRCSAHLARICYGSCLLFALFFIQNLVIGKAVCILLIGLLLLFLFADLLGKALACSLHEKVLGYCAPLSMFFLWISFPITFAFVKAAELLCQKLGSSVGADPLEEVKESLLQILKGANIKGKLSPADKKLLEAALKFKDRIVREVMVPRIDLFSLPEETTLKEAATHFVDEGYSRIPVYQESMDNITGVLMFKDFLKLYQEIIEGKKDLHLLDSPIASLTKTVFYTPETKKVSHLLQEFRSKQMHLAIVVDEYGGTEGVVTMEDILEEIVGEIADEYDFDESVLYTPAAGGGWIVDARMSILDAEDAFGMHIPQEGDYDTIGGYIFHKVGSIPEVGKKIVLQNFLLEILSSSERSIDKIKITQSSEE